MSATDWITQIKAQDERAKAAADARSQEAVQASFAVGQRGPNFWQDLLAALKSNAERLPEIGLYCSVSPSGTPGAETSCHVQVERRGTWPDSTNTVLHYRHGSTAIRGNVPSDSLDGQEFELPLTLGPQGQVGALSCGRVLNAEGTARLIMERMVKMVRPRTAYKN